MANALPNVWHLRTVAEASSRACYVCYKPTARVLITPDSRDFFYTCMGHLNDSGFASPIIDAEAEAAKRKEEAIKQEIEKVKQEYIEKQRRKEEKKQKNKNTTKDDDKAKREDHDDEDAKAEKERDDKIKALKDGGSVSKAVDAPRIFALHKNFYQMRLDRIRNAEHAKKNQQRLRDPTFFPQPPKGDL